jgi:hypothetical protein
VEGFAFGLTEAARKFDRDYTKLLDRSYTTLEATGLDHSTGRDRPPLRLPTFPARWVLGNPRRRAYFVFWTTEYDGELEYCPQDHAERGRRRSARHA